MKSKYRTKVLWTVATTLLAAIVLGCGSRQERAERLYSMGEYQKVIQKYPEQPIARKAQEELGGSLYRNGEYQQLIEQFPDLPLAQNAKESLELLQGVKGAQRAELSGDNLDYYAADAVDPEASADAFYEFLTTAAVRVGQWSREHNRPLAGRVRMSVGLYVYSLDPAECVRAADLWSSGSMEAYSYVRSVMRLETSERMETSTER